MVPTRDHDIIRIWAAKHDAAPAQINPIKFDGQPAILYFLIGKAKDGTRDLHPISWDTFFAQFDLLNLAFAYDEHSPRFHIVSLEKPTSPSLQD